MFFFFLSFFYFLHDIYRKQKRRRDILLEYVQNVQPEIMELFLKRAPPQVLTRELLDMLFFIGDLYALCLLMQSVY